MSASPFSVPAQNANRLVLGQCWIDGQWVDGEGFDPADADSNQLVSTSPCERFKIWAGTVASAKQVDAAVVCAQVAWKSWQRTDLEQRIAVVIKYQEIVKQTADELALLISRETGKPLWESKTEAAAVAGKVDLSISALRTRRDTLVEPSGNDRIVTRYKSHGVLAVLGPFNFPAHLPNGHIIPAILAGNSVVFKPSEVTPAVGQWMVAAWELAGLPPGVLNLVQGGRPTGAALVSHPKIDGLLFTGSSNAGKHFHELMAGQPQKILALEMGGNNPLVVTQVDDIDAAVYQIILSAYLTSGQRCTCARRLILVENNQTQTLVQTLLQRLGGIRVGLFDQDPEPFMGGVVSAESGRQILGAWNGMKQRGGVPLLEMETKAGFASLLTPGLIDMTDVSEKEDKEWFGPLLQIYRVQSLQAAIDEANDTKYGLSAGLLSQSADDWNEFVGQIRAGVVNLNRQTTGASGKLPFGGCGFSGNHRPSGYFAADYCSFPIASMETDLLTLPEQKMVGIRWD